MSKLHEVSKEDREKGVPVCFVEDCNYYPDSMMVFNECDKYVCTKHLFEIKGNYCGDKYE